VLSDLDVPLVLDADGLNAVDGDFLSAYANGNWILTPHEAEFERLGGQPAATGPAIRRARQAAAAWNTIVVLKGMPTVVASPDGRVVVSGTGNSALASAGTGDVLCGLCAGMLARGLSPFEAAITAVHLGGAIADRFVTDSGRSSMMAGDMLRLAGPVLRDRLSLCAS
jgi:NAD(P)H-hydrate epimerase